MTAHLRTLSRRFCPDIIPVFPLDGAVLFPGCELPLNIFEPRYLNMIEDSLRADRLIGMVQNAVGAEQTSATARGAKLAPIGTLGRIKQFAEFDDGRYMIVLVGLKRFRIMTEAEARTPYRQAQVSYEDFTSDIEAHSPPSMPKALSEDKSTRAELTAAMKGFARSLGVEVDWDALGTVAINSLVDQSAMISPFRPFDKQSLLEASTPEARRRLLIALMTLYMSEADKGNDPGARKDLQ